jgi:hypothetical protein
MAEETHHDSSHWDVGAATRDLLRVGATATLLGKTKLVQLTRPEIEDLVHPTTRNLSENHVWKTFLVDLVELQTIR